MSILNQTSFLKFTFQFVFISLLITFLSSCSKENTPNKTGEEAISPSISVNASDRTSVVAIPFEETFFVSCANGGVGEYVHVTGKTNMLYTISWTEHGFTFGYHINTYNVKGVGLTSGQSFVGSGNIEGQVMGAWVNQQWLANFIDQFRLTGNNTNFVVKNKYHVLINPNGTVEVDRDNNEVECK